MPGRKRMHKQPFPIRDIQFIVTQLMHIRIQTICTLFTTEGWRLLVKRLDHQFWLSRPSEPEARSSFAGSPHAP